MPIPQLPVRRLRGVCLALAACGLASLPVPADAQYRETQQGQKGAARIIRIDENGRFNRCAAHIDSSAGALRISWNRNHAYHISTPAVPLNGPLMLRLVDTPGGTISFSATTDGRRAGTQLDMQTMETVLRIRGRIKVQVADPGPRTHVTVCDRRRFS
jgi:hypothetical protein